MGAHFYWGDGSIDLLGGWVEIFGGMGRNLWGDESPGPLDLHPRARSWRVTASDGGRYREAVGTILTAKWSREMKSRDMTSRNMKFS